MFTFVEFSYPETKRPDSMFLVVLVPKRTQGALEADCQ